MWFVWGRIKVLWIRQFKIVKFQKWTIISRIISHNNNLNVNHRFNQFIENTFSVCVLSATSGIWHMSVKVQIRPYMAFKHKTGSMQVTL